jgi:hypothetical protein
MLANEEFKPIGFKDYEFIIVDDYLPRDEYTTIYGECFAPGGYMNNLQAIKLVATSAVALASLYLL